MKLYIISLFFCCACVAQNTIHIQKPVTEFHYYSSISRLGILYTNIENKLVFEIDNVDPRDIVLSLTDTSDIALKEVWRPIEIRSNLEVTYINAEIRNAYNPERGEIKAKYINTNEIRWQKEFVLYPKKVKDYTFLLGYENDTGTVIHSYPKFKCAEIAVSADVSISMAELHSNQKLYSLFDPDLKMGKSVLKIEKFKLSVYDKNNKLLYSDFCYSDFITPEMSAAIRNKKTRRVKIENIESATYKFPDIEIKK